jgi:hypothetical protein
MAWDWRHTPVIASSMLGGRKITATLTGETLGGSVAKWCLQRGIYYPISVKPGVGETIEELGNGSYTLGYVLYSSVENSHILSHTIFVRLWVWNSGVIKFRYHIQKVQHLDQYLQPRSHTQNLLGHWNFSKVQGNKCMNIKAVKKIMFKVNGLLVSLPLLHSFLYYEHIKDTNKALIRNAVLLTPCKHGHRLKLWFIMNFLCDYSHIYKMMCLSVSSELPITGPHSKPNKCIPHIPNLLLQTIF